MARKLQGHERDSAYWSTQVANEIGQVVQCVLTTSEGNASLQLMADGLVARYAKAGVKPPSVIYTDRDCCSSRPGAKGRFSVLFGAWPDLEVRLDIWHFMRRFGKCMVSSSHPLAGPFLQRLVTALLVWDADDLAALRRATHQELVLTGIPSAKLTEVTVPLPFAGSSSYATVDVRPAAWQSRPDWCKNF